VENQVDAEVTDQTIVHAPPAEAILSAGLGAVKKNQANE
jgi:hypothetical protein